LPPEDGERKVSPKKKKKLKIRRKTISKKNLFFELKKIEKIRTNYFISFLQE